MPIILSRQRINAEELCTSGRAIWDHVADTVSLKRIDPNTLEYLFKKDGKVVGSYPALRLNFMAGIRINVPAQ
jgi:hypothetical protein